MKLTEKIHQLRIDFEVILNPEKKLARFVNCILIFGDRITLIDTGVKGSEGKIISYIEENGRDISELRTIILSHSHPDHIGSAARIKELTDCEILAHANEAEWIENIDLQNKTRPVPGFYNLVDRSVNIDRFISDRQIIELDEDITIEIIHSPGHSKGSVNILFTEDRILFTADSVPLRNDIPNYDNYSDLANSLETIRNDKRYNILLTSWTNALTDRVEINKLLNEGKEYINLIDRMVKDTYHGDEPEPLTFCGMTLNKLGLPPFLNNPVVDRAFKSHYIT
jgi:glyoxylase-like metal-dependent hydrolase (beta-lactamase superfamily II)